MFSKAKQKNSGNDGGKAVAQESTTISAAASGSGSSKKTNTMRPAGVPSIISADVMMRGNINSNGEVQLDGALDGDIKAATLIVGDKASVKGEIVCEKVTVRGRVEGAIRAKQVSLAATAHIEGDILHSALSVESGAHFEGNCRHSDDPLSEAASSDFRRSRPSGNGASPAPRPVSSGSMSGDDNLAANAGSGDAPTFLSQNRSPLR